MAADYYFNFLSSVLDNLSEDDKQVFAETWRGYEQIFGDVYQEWLEVELNSSVADTQVYTTERWLPYDLNTKNAVFRPVTYTSNQDISGGVNLSQKYLIRFSVDNGPEIEVDLRGSEPLRTTLPEIVERINNAAGFAFAKGIFDNAVLQFTTKLNTPVASIVFHKPSVAARDASEFVLGILNEDLPVSVPDYPHVYSSPYPEDKIVSIPTLQDKIRPESEPNILEENVDYIFEKDLGTLAFKEKPAETLWARTTFVDQETPWNNFGWLMNIYDENSPQYLNVVQGLWFAFWTGPKPANVRSSLYLLFGLPVAPEEGTVREVTSTTVTMIGTVSGELFEFEIPDELEAVVAVGDSVTRYQPLVNGIEVFDKINSPGFIEREIGRAGIQNFLLDGATRGTSPDTDESKALFLLEEHTFLPQISVEAFISPDINLSNVKRFLTDIKPLNKTFLFQVIVGKFTDAINVAESIGLDVFIDITPNVDSNQTTFAEESILDDYELNDNLALNVDSDILGASEIVEIEVVDKNGPVESFIV